MLIDSPDGGARLLLAFDLDKPGKAYDMSGRRWWSRCTSGVGARERVDGFELDAGYMPGGYDSGGVSVDVTALGHAS